MRLAMGVRLHNVPRDGGGDLSRCTQWHRDGSASAMRLAMSTPRDGQQEMCATMHRVLLAMRDDLARCIVAAS